MDERNHTINFTDRALNGMPQEVRENFILPDLNEEISKIEHDDSLTAEEKIRRQDEITRDFAIKSEKIHNSNQLLRAYTLFEKDQQYVVQDGKVIKVTGVEDVGPNYGSLCVKGRFGYEFINHEERLTKPLIKENGEFREATWDEALEHVAQRFKKVREESGSDSIGVFCSARMTNEENYVAQKFTRAALGTNNIDHCARL